jgi:TorA maturation chaperone TorD
LSAANALRTLARVFARPLGEVDVGALLDADHALSEALREDASRSGRNALREALAEEFTRLFVGPAHHHPPLAGLMRGDDELLGPLAREVTRAYREADLEPDPASGVLPDHLSVALGFLAELLERDSPGDAAHFTKQHLHSWVPAWVDRYRAAARLRFYAAAGPEASASSRRRSA